MPDIVDIQPFVGRVLLSWFPWITSDDCNILDRNLNRKVATGGRGLTTADVLTALKWYDNVPEGFKSGRDVQAASLLSESIAAAMNK